MPLTKMAYNRQMSGLIFTESVTMERFTYFSDYFNNSRFGDFRW